MIKSIIQSKVLEFEEYNTKSKQQETRNVCSGASAFMNVARDSHLDTKMSLRNAAVQGDVMADGPPKKKSKTVQAYDVISK